MARVATLLSDQLPPGAARSIFETVERILDAEVPGLAPLELLVRDYALAVTRQRVGDTLVARLREHFSEAQIVELTLRAALCAFFARFNEALDVELENEYQPVGVIA